MAGQGQPGPVCGYSKPQNVDDGTLCRAQSPQPGSVSSGVVATFFSKVDSTFSWVADSVGAEYNAVTTTLEVKYDSLQRGIRDDFTGALCIFHAYTLAQEFAPDAVLEETGCQLKSLISGLIPGLLQMIAILGASTLLGAGIGAAIGALAGGVGAAPGAVVGADLGFDLGMAALTWLGVAFLAVAIVKGFAELLEAIRNGVEWAWAARTLQGTAQKEQVDKAAHELARAAGIVMRLVLQGILAYLLKKAAMSSTRGAIGTLRGLQARGAVAGAEVSVAELVGKLRASKFGDGFADWVEKNWRDLQKNPKLQPKAADIERPLKPEGSASGDTGGGGSGGQKSPSAAQDAAEDEPQNEPAPTKPGGFDALRQRRQQLGLPPAGAEGDSATLAQVDIGGQSFDGINRGLQDPKTPMTLERVNAQTLTHAEADAVQSAVDGGAKGSADTAEMWVDRDPCRACGDRGGLRSLARELGVKQLVVHSPSGTNVYTPTL